MLFEESHSYLVALIEKQGPVPIHEINSQRRYMYDEEHVEIAKRLQGTGTDLNDFIVKNFYFDRSRKIKLNLFYKQTKNRNETG